MVFLVVMYGCESWTIKKAEHRRIDAFELWCWRRLLRVPWTVRRSNHSALKDINPGCSLEGMMLKLKLQYFGHFKRRVDSLEKTDAGRDWGQEEKGTTEDEMASPTWWTWIWVNSGSWWWTGRPGMLQFMGSQRVGHDWTTELNWGTRDQIANICWIMEKGGEFQKNIYFCFIDYAKALTVWLTINCGKFWKRWKYRTTCPAS